MYILEKQVKSYTGSQLQKRPRINILELRKSLGILSIQWVANYHARPMMGPLMGHDMR